MKKQIWGIIALIILAPVFFLTACKLSNNDKGDDKPEQELHIPAPEWVPAFTPAPLRNLRTSVDDGLILLSVPAGIYANPFTLTVEAPSGSAIYYTIDGTNPVPGEDRFITRREKQIKVAGQLPQSGEILVEDRSGHWLDSILTSSAQRWGVQPVENTVILSGTTFRFRAFVNGLPVTAVKTATYIISDDFAARFANMPVISVTAPYNDFLFIYENINPFDGITRRREFNYEYFEFDNGVYDFKFSLPGSTQLGGTGSRDMAQRTFNVSLVRGNLIGHITHPIFNGLADVRRFRLWNGGNSFLWDHTRDPFAQRASAAMNVGYAENSVAIKFINGEYWGFTAFREHSTNAEFTETRFGIDRNNIAIYSAAWEPAPGGNKRFFHELEEGNARIVEPLYSRLIEFVTRNNMSANNAREYLFEHFFCQDNFMDYLITKTFFADADWPQNNLMIYRAITPVNDGNPLNDGKWRFILNDLDYTAHVNGSPQDSRFQRLYNLQEDAPVFNTVFLVLNNKVFAQSFRTRALEVLDTHFKKETLINLYQDLISLRQPLLNDMYTRYPNHEGSVSASIANFEVWRDYMFFFLENRHEHYKAQLDYLVNR